MPRTFRAATAIDANAPSLSFVFRFKSTGGGGKLPKRGEPLSRWGGTTDDQINSNDDAWFGLFSGQKRKEYEVRTHASRAAAHL